MLKAFCFDEQDLSAFSSPEELASLGLDRIKSALMALGLKCGGTLEERSNRLFGTKGKKLSELDPNIFAKTKGGGSKGEKSAKESEKHKEIASMESQVKKNYLPWLQAMHNMKSSFNPPPPPHPLPIFPRNVFNACFNSDYAIEMELMKSAFTTLSKVHLIYYVNIGVTYVNVVTTMVEM